MLRLLYLVAALMMSFGIIILLGLTPEVVTEDIMRLLNRDRTLRYQIRSTQGRIKKSRLQQGINNLKNALQSTHSEAKFSVLITISAVGICVGCLLAGLFNNLLLVPLISGVCLLIPYVYVSMMISGYTKRVNDELETALSIITTNYTANNDIIYAVEQSIDYINPPVQYAFKKFLGQTKMINSNVKLAIEQLKEEINNQVFWDWCDSLIKCQDNSTFKMTLQPIAANLSNLRIVNAELKNMLMNPRREFLMMVGLVIANYPLLFFLNAEWFSVLTTTLVGQIVNCIVAITIIITTALTYKYTQPLQITR